MQTIVSVMLKESGRFWIAAGAAGGSELPECSEPFRLRVALPVALGHVLGLSPSGSAALAGSSTSKEESVGASLRWLRCVVDLPPGGFDGLGLQRREGQSSTARNTPAL